MKERRLRNYPLFVWWLLLLLSMGPHSVWACRYLEPPSDSGNTLWVHLEGLCFSSDQQEWAVPGREILEALKAGKNIDVQGILVEDDVMLDQLLPQPLGEIPNIPSSIQKTLQQRGLQKVRVIPGSISIQDSQFENVLATNLVDDVLVILGEVTITNTTFRQSMDFSKIIFAKPIVLSNMEVIHEGFFIGAQFEDVADFSNVRFGTHSRFHKAAFRAPVFFTNTEFKGVAEFLEVAFHQTADFAQSKFFGGTGFSGSVFHGPADFSGMTTQREIYFRFSEFHQQVSFRQGIFHNVVDFSNSRFDDEYDFAEAEFARQPEFSGSNISLVVPIVGQASNRQIQWLVFCGLILLVGIYLWITKRESRSLSS